VRTRSQSFSPQKFLGTQAGSAGWSLRVTRPREQCRALLAALTEALLLQPCCCNPTQEGQPQPPWRFREMGQEGGALSVSSGLCSCSVSPQARSHTQQRPQDPLSLPPPGWVAQPLFCRAQGVARRQQGAGVSSARLIASAPEPLNPGPEESGFCLCFLALHPCPSLSLLVAYRSVPPRPAINQIHVLGPSLACKSVLLAPLPSLRDVSWPASPTTALPPQETLRAGAASLQERWDGELEKRVGQDPQLLSTGTPGDFAPMKGTAASHGAPLLQHKHTQRGREAMISWPGFARAI